MAHELSVREDGKVEHAYVGRVGWHGLGNRLEEGASIEDWQEAAGMDWTIKRAKVRYATDRDVRDPREPTGFREFPNKVVLFRSDNKSALSIVSDAFKVVQPGEILEFFRDLTSNSGFKLETAGVLFGGRQFWALAHAGDSAEIGRGDWVRRYLLLSTSCDGSLATEGRFTDVRVVCNNTLSAAVRHDDAKVRVTHRSVFDPLEMKTSLGVRSHETFEDQMALFRRLADTRLIEREVIEMSAELFYPGVARRSRDDYAKAIQSRPVVSVVELALDGTAKGASLDGVKDTAWGWLNAVTEYVDHHARARSADNRVASAWFGKGDALKARALEMASAA